MLMILQRKSTHIYKRTYIRHALRLYASHCVVRNSEHLYDQLNATGWIQLNLIF